MPNHSKTLPKLQKFSKNSKFSAQIFGLFFAILRPIMTHTSPKYSKPFQKLPQNSNFFAQIFGHFSPFKGQLLVTYGPSVL